MKSTLVKAHVTPPTNNFTAGRLVVSKRSGQVLLVVMDDRVGDGSLFAGVSIFAGENTVGFPGEILHYSEPDYVPFHGKVELEGP